MRTAVTVGVLAFALIAPGLPAATIEIGPTADFRNTMKGLQPGDTLILDGGTYSFSGYFELDIAGTSGQPILIQARSGQQPVIAYNGTDQNIVNINNGAYLTFDGIEFSGGSRGLRFIGGSNVTVRNCHVHGTAANAIAANDDGYVYANFKFIHNEIDHTGDTGEAFYQGCNNDACRIHDSLVANNYIHDLNGATITQGDGIEIKQGSYGNVVQDNVIHDTGYPGITMYDVHGEGGINIIQRNIVWNTGDNGIQVTADAIVRNNIVLSEGPGASAFASNNVQGGSAANLVVVNNTFLAVNNVGVRFNSISGSVTAANNAIYASTALFASGTLAQVSIVANAGQGTLNGVSSGFNAAGNLLSDFFSANLSGVPPQNLLPTSFVLAGTANAAQLALDDFDGHPRGAHHDIGAYRADVSGVPGWVLQAGFKTLDEVFFDGFGP